MSLVLPWAEEVVRITVEEKQLDLHVNFIKGSSFPCLVCGRECPDYETQKKVWRDLDFFQHAAYLHGRVSLVQSPEHKVHLVLHPWAQEMPVLTLGRLIRETDHGG